MATKLNSEESFLKDNAPGLIGTWGTPAIPADGDSPWTGLNAALAAENEGKNLTDGELLIGKSAQAAITRPSAAPVLTAGTGGTLVGGSGSAGDYTVAYTYVNENGETQATTTPATIHFASGSTNKINVAALTVPSGVSTVYWYLSDAPGSGTLRFVAYNSGGAFSITALPVSGAATPPATNGTASANHVKKGQITGSNGLTVTNGPGTIDIALANTGDIQTIGGVVTVVGVQGIDYDATTPTNGQSYAYDSTSGTMKPASGTVTSAATTTANGIGKVSVGPVDVAHPIFVGDNDPRMTDARTPVGTSLTSGKVWVGNGSNLAAAQTVSGDGTLSNAGVLAVTKVAGIAVTGTPAIGDTITATSTSAAHWAAPTGGGGGTTINSGTSFPGSPTTGDLFIRTDLNTLNRWSGSAWTVEGFSNALASTHIFVGNGSGVATDVAMTGGTTISNTGYVTVTKVQDIPMQSGTPTDNYVWKYNATANQWQYSPESNNITLGCRVENHVGTSVTTSTFTKISFEQEVFDTASYHSTSTNPTRITVPVGQAGYYLVIANCAFSNPASTSVTGVKQIAVKYNNTTYIAEEQTGSGDAGVGAMLSTSAVYYFANGDYAELEVWQNTGVTLNAGTAGGFANLTMIKVQGGGATLTHGTSLPGSGYDGDLFINTGTTPPSLYYYNLSTTSWVLVAGSTQLPHGTSFPGSPTTNDQFVRDDLNTLSRYDGSTWQTIGGTGGGGGTFAGVKASKSTNTTLPDATDTALAFDTEYYDTNAFHDNSTNPTRFTVPTGYGGYYQILGTARFGAQTGGGNASKNLIIKKNGTTELARYATTNATNEEFWQLQVAAIESLSAGDYVELVLRSNSGGSISIDSFSTYPSLTMVKIG